MSIGKWSFSREHSTGKLTVVSTFENDVSQYLDHKLTQEIIRQTSEIYVKENYAKLVATIKPKDILAAVEAEVAKEMLRKITQ